MWSNFIRFIKRILGMNIIPQAPSLNTRMRKFRFIVTNSGEHGGMRVGEQPQVAMAPSPQYLINLFRASGDEINILEELPPDEETRNYGKANISEAIAAAERPGWAGRGEYPSTGMLPMTATPEQIRALEAMHGGAKPSPQQPAAQAPSPSPAPAPAPQAPPAAPPPSQPTYFKIGSVECKMENGKVYQKQWMRVTETEMANYRLISDKNNKILPMDGKHLEVLKWAISEDETNAQG